MTARGLCAKPLNRINNHAFEGTRNTAKIVAAKHMTTATKSAVAIECAATTPANADPNGNPR